MKTYLKINLALWGMILCIILKCCSPVEAQTSRNPCYTTGNGIDGMPNCIGVGTNTPLPVTASVTASISPFIPAASGARGTPIAVGTTDSSGTLPTNTGAILVSNPGATLAYCNVNGIAATTADTPIAPGGGAVGLGVPSGVTTLHCISTGAGTTINTLGGSGLIAITGGGSSSGGGGGGTVTQGPAGASPWLVTGAGGTFPVTGTFWQATQPVSIATMPSTPVTGTFFQSTQPVSLATAPTTSVTGTFWPYTLGQQLAAASVPVILPTATITTLTPPTTVAVTQATGSNLNATVAPSTIAAWGLTASTQNTATPTNSQLVDCQFNTTPTTVTTGNITPIQCNNAGALNVAIVSGGGSGGTASSFGSAFPATGTAIGLTNGTNMVAWSATSNYGTAPSAIPVPAVNANVTNSNANGQATAANSSPVVLPAAQITVDPCTLGAKTNFPISQNGTASVQLIALSGSTTIYVCSLSLIAAGATTVAITTGTGTACATGNAAVVGTTTASIANSMSLAANGGLTLGNGAGTVAKGAASGELCMILGTSVFVSGNLTYVQL